MSPSDPNQPIDPSRAASNPFGESDGSSPYGDQRESSSTPLHDTQYYSPQSGSSSPLSSAPIADSVKQSAASSNQGMYFVRIPGGQEFGPASASTIVEWQTQGRVNETCFIREQNAPTGQPFAQWLATYQASVKSPEFSVDRSANIYGDRFGQVHVPANQTATPSGGNGTLIMWLGISSWLLCITLFGGAILAMVVVIMGAMELGRINTGKTPASEKTLVWIGLGFAIGNLALTFLLLVLIVLSAIFS